MAEKNLIERPPIVAVLGHVDHGKSTLLDFIRKANVVSREAGGITQHVGAYEVEREKDGKNKRITFIDTPGHAAFKAIRARGATVADVAILVVAADDGVKAQTLEALESIRGAHTPFVVAINKIDKPNADIARTQASLLENNVFLEKFGGDVPWVAISAKSGQGVDELLDLILIVAEFLELRADREAATSGYVIEAHRDKKRGIAATLIIRNGTLRQGDYVRAGRGIAPVRIMEDHLGKTLKEASFSTPVQLVGFDELPDAGSEFAVHKSKRDAEDAREADPTAKSTSPLFLSNENGDIFHLPVIIRADTTGSLDAIKLETLKLGSDTAKVHIIQSGIGAITEDDVNTSISAIPRDGGSPAAVIGFNVGIERVAETFARERGVAIETFDIIYKLTERLEDLLQTTRPKKATDEVMGRAKLLKVFSSRKTEHLIGAEVLDGALNRKGAIHIMRRGTLVGKGKIVTLQSNRQTVDKVETEGQFGAQLESDVEPMQGDVLECFITKMV